jgi:hypothetical protein
MHQGANFGWDEGRNSCVAVALTPKDLCAAVTTVPVTAAQLHLLGQPGCRSSQGKGHPQARTPV